MAAGSQIKRCSEGFLSQHGSDDRLTLSALLRRLDSVWTSGLKLRPACSVASLPAPDKTSEHCQTFLPQLPNAGEGQRRNEHR